jgi:hypothetical protein
MVRCGHGDRIEIVPLKQSPDVVFGLRSVAADLLYLGYSIREKPLVHVAEIGNTHAWHSGEGLVVASSAAPEADDADVYGVIRARLGLGGLNP